MASTTSSVMTSTATTTTTTTTMLLQNRIQAALRGALVADAASMGTHWIYNPTELKEVLLLSSPQERMPEFQPDPPTPRFYSSSEFPGHYDKVGMPSPYGEQLLFVADYVANGDDGGVDGHQMSLQMKEWAEAFGGRPDSALQTFLANMNKEDGQWPNCGDPNDSQAHIYMKVVPVTCLYVGQPNLVEKVTEAIRVHQNNDTAVAFGVAAARLLEAVLLYGVTGVGEKSIDDAEDDNDDDDSKTKLAAILKTWEDNVMMVEQQSKENLAVCDSITRARRTMSTSAELQDLDAVLLSWSHEVMKDQPDSPFYHLAGRSCALPGSFLGPLYLFYKAAAGQYGADNSADTEGGGGCWYEKALRENILAAGDTCSRAVFVGAILAALAESVPAAWIDQTDAGTLARMDAAAAAIAEQVATTLKRDDGARQCPINK